MVKYANIEGCKAEGNPQPRLDAYGYTLRSGSPTRYKALVDGRYRRIYCLCFSNAASYFVRTPSGDQYVSTGQFASIQRLCG